MVYLPFHLHDKGNILAGPGHVFLAAWWQVCSYKASSFSLLTGPNLPSLTLWLSLAVKGLLKPLTNLSIGYK